MDVGPERGWSAGGWEHSGGGSSSSWWVTKSVAFVCLRSEAGRCCQARMSPRTRVCPSRVVHRELAQQPAAGHEGWGRGRAQRRHRSHPLPLATVRTFPLLGWPPSSVSTVPTFTLSLGKHEKLFGPRNALREWESRAWQTATLLLLQGCCG